MLTPGDFSALPKDTSPDEPGGAMIQSYDWWVTAIHLEPLPHRISSDLLLSGRRLTFIHVPHLMAYVTGQIFL